MSLQLEEFGNEIYSSLYEWVIKEDYKFNKILFDLSKFMFDIQRKEIYSDFFMQNVDLNSLSILMLHIKTYENNIKRHWIEDFVQICSQSIEICSNLRTINEDHSILFKVFYSLIFL